MLVIGADARCLNVAHLRGMGKYLSQIVVRTVREDGVQWRLYGDRPDWPMQGPLGKRACAEVFEMRGYRLRTWEQIGLPRRARNARNDVLHCAGSTLPWWQPVPTVVTLHDTVPWETEESNLDPPWYLRGVIPAALRKCAAVITISECSRRDILRLWPALAEKIHVIPHGVDDEYVHVRPGPLDEEVCRLGVRRPYLLYVGGDIPRKRLAWALEIHGALRMPEVQLVVVGSGNSAPRCEGLCKGTDAASSVIFLPFIGEANMPRLYQNAVAVLYPTLYEGFGLPALEAQAVGTPVLFSDVGSLAELKGPGAVVLPTEDLGAWVETCRRLLAACAVTPRLNEAARQWARRFSWDASATRHLEVYRQVVAATSRARH